MDCALSRSCLSYFLFNSQKKKKIAEGFNRLLVFLMFMHTLWIAELRMVMLALTDISFTDIWCCRVFDACWVFCFSRSIFQRSLSAGNILHESSPASATKEKHVSNSVFPDRLQGASNFLSESSPEISSCESDIAFSRFGYIICLCRIH